MLRPKPHQREATNAVLREFRTTTRAKCIAPCGCGKTLIGQMVRKELAPERTLVTAPSLALLKQTIDDYSAQGSLDRPPYVVCCDNTTAEEAREQYDIPRATTDPATVANVLRGDDGAMLFSTYQSMPRIVEAFSQKSVPNIGLAIFDEAHRMAGGFSDGLYDDRVPIDHRLFLTATPRINDRDATVVSMDDEFLFGREAYYMSFGQAIRKGLLADFQVIVAMIKESELTQFLHRDRKANELAHQIALARVIQQHDVRRVLTYHSSVAQMERFVSEGFAKIYEQLEFDRQLWIDGLSGKHKAKRRSECLREFASLDNDHIGIVGNCRVLGEGINIPEIDGVAFMDTKSSLIDIVQAIGRALRLHGDKLAKIILPVFVTATGEQNIEAFLSQKCKVMWSVISAILAHDERIRDVAKQRSGSVELKKRIKFAGPSFPPEMCDRLINVIETRIVRWNYAGLKLDRGKIKQWITDHKTRFGVYPTTGSREPSPCGLPWSVLQSCLFQGLRGLQPGSSLIQLRQELGDEKAKPRKRRCPAKPPDVTLDQLRTWLLDFWEKHGRLPDWTDGIAPDGSTWASLQNAAKTGLRGLTGGMTFTEVAGIRMQLSVELLTQWILDHRRAHGKWPVTYTTDKAPDGTSWTAISQATRRRLRGYPKDSPTLAELIQQLRANHDAEDRP